MAKYKKISNNINEVTISNNHTPGKEVRWIDISDPGKNELEYLRKNFGFKMAHLQASSSKTVSQRPLIEKEKGYIFLILHFPILRTNNVYGEEIDFFIGKNFIITLRKNKVIPLDRLFEICKKDGDSLLCHQYETPEVLLYEILDRLMMDCFSLLDKNSVDINDVEDLIFEQKSKIAVSKILTLRRNIINTRRIMQNHKNIIKKMTTPEEGLKLKVDVKRFYLKLLDLSKKIWENLESQKEMVEVLNSTNESFLNYRISDIMKTLTIFSVIVFPLTLLAAIFGMNTVEGMPFKDTPNGFWIVITIMLFGSLGMLIFFEKKKWL